MSGNLRAGLAGPMAPLFDARLLPGGLPARTIARISARTHESYTMTISNAEWLEADGLGGFASGRADGIRTRRYHALLLAATTPPTGRVALVNGVDAFVRDTDGGRVALT